MNDTSPSHPATKRSYGTPRPKVPPFARYVGTSAWRKYRNRVREYYRFLAAEKLAETKSAPTN